MAIKIHTIVTHWGMHFDEIVGYFFLYMFGEKKYPGIEKAEFKFWKTGGKIPDGKTAEDYERRGFLLLGIGGGKFDEHPLQDGGRKEGQCVASLVAEDLGISNMGSVREIIKFATNNDLNGAGNAWDIPHMMIDMWKAVDRDPKLFSPNKIVNWAFQAIYAKHENLKNYYAKTRHQFQKGQISRISVPERKGEIAIAVVESDDPFVSKWGREQANCTVIIQKNSNGNVQIFSNKKHGVKIEKIALAICQKEAGIKGVKIPTELNGEGRAPEVDEWYYHPKLQALLNGSLTASEVPPTKIDLPTILEIAKANIAF